MTYLHTVVRGTITGASTFSMGVDFDIPLPANPAVNQAQIDGWAESVWTAYKTQVLSGTQDSRASCGNQVTFTGVDAYLTPAPGIGPTILKGSSSSAAIPGSSASIHPAQIAVVVTKLTSNPTSRGRGRMYLPALACGLFGTVQMANAEALKIATAHANWIAAVNLISINGQSVIGAVIGGVNKDTRFPITRVRVDTVPDTMRPRRDKIIANSRPIVSVPVG